MRRILCFILIFITPSLTFAAINGESLPSWNDGITKRQIINFINEVEEKDIPESERIAVFDNDGTLWNEYPMYLQVFFMFDRIHALAPKHPEWKTKEPYKSVLEGNHAALAAMDQHELLKLLAETHSGMTELEFRKIAGDWVRTALHPITKKPIKDMAYKPMVELLQVLRDNDFKTFIVSGGGIDFIRSFAEDVYGIPPEQVIGSSGKTKFEMKNGKPTLTKLPEILLVSDGVGKPEAIHLHIGRQPIFAFGNSDGDLQMLQYTSGNSRPKLMLLLHHDDGIRESAYDRKSSIGRLDKALDEAKAKGWSIVSMKKDFKEIYSWE